MVRMKTRKIFEILIFVIPILILGLIFYIKFISIEEKETEGLIISEIMAKNLCGIQDEDGEYSDWIEIYNNTTETIKLEGYGLSDTKREPYKWIFPDIEIKSGEYMVIWASGKDRRTNSNNLHTNFKLGKSGEELILTDNDGKLISECSYPEMEWDISYGYIPVKVEYGYLSKPTPGASNTNELLVAKEIKEDVLAPVVFSNASGVYEEEFELQLSCEDEDAIILYTEDGSEPVLESKLYTHPILIEDVSKKPNKWSTVPCTASDSRNLQYGFNNVNKCNTIRARVYKDGVLSSEISTETYIVGNTYTMPIVSIVTDPNTLFNEKDGMYVMGETYWRAWRSNPLERKKLASVYFGKTSSGAVEIINPDGKCIFNDRINLKVGGASSRATLVQKSFTIECVSDKYKDDKGREYLSTLNLKSQGGGSTYPLLYQNHLLMNLANELGISPYGGEFVIVYVDGEYWGIYYLYDKLNEDYISNTYGIAQNNLYYISSGMENSVFVWKSEAGGNEAIADIKSLYQEVKERDFTKKENYDWISNQVDLDNFMTYMAFELYTGNMDWLTYYNNNVVMFKSKECDGASQYSDGRWRWIAHDMDYSMISPQAANLSAVLVYDPVIDNSFCVEERYLTSLLFQKLWLNDEFKYAYGLKTVEMLDGVLSTEHVREMLDEQVFILQGEMQENIERIELDFTPRQKMIDTLVGESIVYPNLSMTDFDNGVSELYRFIEERPDYIRGYIVDYTGIADGM